ncbi:MAG: response regulator [Chitinivibrionia bacterium]|nr:response regulator [Chitinivibrionia bacterium]
MQKKQILWIDDEVEFFRAHMMFLEARGYNVHPIQSGNEGLSLLHKTPNAYDIVLLDEQMPGKGGLEVLSGIKKILPDLPVVMVTKSEEEDLMEKAIGKKIDGYLTKPVNPSQILMTCKRLLQSQEILSESVKNAFVKSYSEIETLLQNKTDISYKKWVKIYQLIVKRELDAENIDDENIRQKHYAQKAEINARFADFVIYNYPAWIKNTDENTEKPTISTEIMQKYICPQINKNKKFALIVLDSVQLDQFVIIQRFLKKIFKTNGTYFYFSVLPTTTPHALSSFFTGLLPAEFAKEKPDLWENLASGTNVFREIAEFGFKRLNCEKTPLFFNMSKESAKAENAVLQMNNEKNFPVIFTDFLDLLQSNKQNKFIKEIISSSKAFREMTSVWFEKSELHKLLQIMSRENYTIAFTPCSGNILCTASAQYYGAANGYHNLRFRSGENIDADKRAGFHLKHPSDYGLPIKDEKTGANILSQNYYFTPHPSGKANVIMKHPTSIFEKGGVSLEETIIPLAIMNPIKQQ